MASRFAVIVALAWFASACVRVESGCEGMSISPSAWSSRIGKSRVFTATTQGVVDPSVTWEFPTSGGGLSQNGLLSNQVRVVLGASNGGFRLKARSNENADRKCICVIQATDFSFSFTRPITIPGSNSTIIVGDVAVGADPPGALTEGSSTGRVVVASFTQDGALVRTRIQQFELDEFFSSSPTPRYDTADTSFSPGFSATNRAAIVADGAGNAYWIDDPDFGGRLGFVRADVGAGEVPPTFDLPQSEIFMDSSSGIAADAAGNVYLLGFPSGSAGLPIGDPSLIRMSGFESGFPGGTTLGEGTVDEAFESRLAIDVNGRILLLSNAGSSSPRLRRFFPDGTLDGSLAPLPATIEFAYDVGVDAQLGIYLVASSGGGGSAVGPAPGSEIRILNDFGLLVTTLTASGGGASFENLVGLGVAPDGTFVVVDDIQSTDQAADVIVIEP